MAEEIDYESLGSSAPIGISMLAGSLAGITEHAVIFPVDSIKTRMQVYSTQPAAIYTGMSQAFSRISSTEGASRLWRGVWSVVLGAGPAHAVYFGTYEAVKHAAGGNREGHQFLATAFAGASATIMSDALMNPFDVIKQRMQVHDSQFRTVSEAARTVYRTEGLRAFYLSYPTTLVMTVPFTAVQFSTYEFFKDVLNPSGEYSPTTHVLAGAVAGGVGAAVTTPLDVCKTMLQTRGNSSDKEIKNASGMVDAAKIVWKRSGARGFLRGLTPRVLTFMPSNALSWVTYEGFKVFFKSASKEVPPLVQTGM